MMTDKQLFFSQGQALTDGATSENILNVGTGDAGMGNNMSLFVSVDGAPSSELVVRMETSDKPDMSNPVKLPDYPAAARVVAVGGVVIDSRLPTGCKKYLRLTYKGVAGGKVTAGLAKDVR